MVLKYNNNLLTAENAIYIYEPIRVGATEESRRIVQLETQSTTYFSTLYLNTTEVYATLFPSQRWQQNN